MNNSISNHDISKEKIKYEYLNYILDIKITEKCNQRMFRICIIVQLYTVIMVERQIMTHSTINRAVIISGLVWCIIKEGNYTQMYNSNKKL